MTEAFPVQEAGTVNDHSRRGELQLSSVVGLGRVAADPTPGLRLHWIKSRETRSDMGATITRLLQMLRADYPAVKPLLAAPMKEVKANLVVGSDDAGRAAVGKDAQVRLWEAIPPAVQLLCLEP